MDPDTLGTDRSAVIFRFVLRNFKGMLSVLKQFLVTESPLKTMKKDFHFNLKALFVLKIFKFFFFTFWSCRKTNLRLILKIVTL